MAYTHIKKHKRNLKIVEAYNSGISAEILARRYKITSRRVYAITKRYNELNRRPVSHTRLSK